MPRKTIKMAAWALAAVVGLWLSNAPLVITAVNGLSESVTEQR